jgi:hypothetical protein
LSESSWLRVRKIAALFWGSLPTFGTLNGWIQKDGDVLVGGFLSLKLTLASVFQ